jgi:hypothetical protein
MVHDRTITITLPRMHHRRIVNFIECTVIRIVCGSARNLNYCTPAAPGGIIDYSFDWIDSNGMDWDDSTGRIGGKNKRGGCWKDAGSSNRF